MIIRLANINDIPSISKLAKETYAETFGFSMTKDELEKELENNKSEIFFYNSMHKKSDDYLVAEHDNKIIGYIGLQNVNIEFEGRQATSKDQALNGVYVSSEYHRQGIGRQLMDDAFKRLRFTVAENIYLCVWEENKPAYQFYLSYGFKAVGQKEFKADGKVIGYDLVMMKAVKQ